MIRYRYFIIFFRNGKGEAGENLLEKTVLSFKIKCEKS